MAEVRVSRSPVVSAIRGASEADHDQQKTENAVRRHERGEDSIEVRWDRALSIVVGEMGPTSHAVANSQGSSIEGVEVPSNRRRQPTRGLRQRHDWVRIEWGIHRPGDLWSTSGGFPMMGGHGGGCQPAAIERGRASAHPHP